jgi:hypothetical protein
MSLRLASLDASPYPRSMSVLFHSFESKRAHQPFSPFWGNFTIVVKMIFLPLFACATRASLALAGHGSIVTPVQLVVATAVAIILVVAVMPMLVVVLCACLGGCFLGA